MNNNRFQYSGRENDGNGLYFFRFRYYSPRLQRFISEDPIGFAGGASNLYLYGDNDAINHTDLYGLDWLNDTSTFIAEAGDSLTFEATGAIRDFIGDNSIGGPNPVNRCSNAYKAGEYSEMADEAALTLGSSALKAATKNVSRKAVRNATRRFTQQIAEEGMEVHHINPLFGHPGPASTLFPLGGLPASINSGSWNLKLLSKAAHLAEHRRLRALEAVATTVVNPAATSGRFANSLAGRSCGCE